MERCLSEHVRLATTVTPPRRGDRERDAASRSARGVPVACVRASHGDRHPALGPGQSRARTRPATMAPPGPPPTATRTRSSPCSQTKPSSGRDAGGTAGLAVQKWMFGGLGGRENGHGCRLGSLGDDLGRWALLAPGLTGGFATRAAADTRRGQVLRRVWRGHGGCSTARSRGAQGRHGAVRGLGGVSLPAPSSWTRRASARYCRRFTRGCVQSWGGSAGWPKSSPAMW